MNILGIKYNNLTQREAIDRIFLLLSKNENINAYFFNADCLYKAQRDEEYRDILNSAELVLPDGIGLRIATRILGGKLKEVGVRGKQSFLESFSYEKLSEKLEIAYKSFL